MIDFSINKDNLLVTKDIDIIKQEIDLLFDTNHGDVLGDEEFGTQYDRYLYNLNVSNEALESVVMSDLQTIELFNYIPTVKAYFLQGTKKDICILDITLSNEQSETVFNQSYTIK